MERAEGAKIFADLFHKWQFQNVKLDNFHPNNPDILSLWQSLIVSTWVKLLTSAKYVWLLLTFLLTKNYVWLLLAFTDFSWWYEPCRGASLLHFEKIDVIFFEKKIIRKWNFFLLFLGLWYYHRIGNFVRITNHPTFVRLQPLVYELWWF